MKNLKIGKANELVNEKYFLESIKKLIQSSIKYDPTLVLHEDKVLLDKYKHSVIALLDGKMIGNSSIYPTQMKPLNLLNNTG